MIKRILKEMWKQKLATFLVMSGCINLLSHNIVTGITFIILGVALYDDETDPLLK